MFSSTFSNSNSDKIHDKSNEILSLARNISNYLQYDLRDLECCGKENSHIYLTGDIIQQSFSLRSHLLKAEEKFFQDEKYHHAISVLNLSNRLYRNCKKLQSAKSNGKDYLPVILKEIKRFRKLLRRWLLTL